MRCLCNYSARLLNRFTIYLQTYNIYNVYSYEYVCVCYVYRYTVYNIILVICEYSYTVIYNNIIIIIVCVYYVDLCALKYV